MNTHELTALDSELRGNTDNVDTLKEMKALTRQEIYTRVNQNQQDEILEILTPALKTRLGSILNDEKTAPQFFEVFQDAAWGIPLERTGIS